MTDPRTCPDCGETFRTISRQRLHDCPEELEQFEHETSPTGPTGHDLADGPDWDDPFAPDPNSDDLVRCLHCGDVYPEREAVYTARFGSPLALWRCRNTHCDGRGVGFDLVPA